MQSLSYTPHRSMLSDKTFSFWVMFESLAYSGFVSLLMKSEAQAQLAQKNGGSDFARKYQIPEGKEINFYLYFHIEDAQKSTSDCSFV